MELVGAMRLARKLMDEHGLHEWRLLGDDAKRRAGACRYGTRTISLSRPLTHLHDETEVRETVLHEIAHALAGPAAGHGPQWQSIATAIGSTGARCVDADAPRLEGDWRGRCPAGHEADRHRRPTRVLLCTRCPGTLPPLQRVMQWTWRGTEAPMHPNYRAELETLLSPGVRLPRIGDVVRLQVRGPLAGATARVTAARRTRFVVDVAGRSYVVAKGACQPVSR